MVAAHLGRLFEVGFNIGILAAISQHNIPHNFGTLYQQDLQTITFAKVLKELCRDANIIDPGDIYKVETWGLFLLQKGWLSGLNFFREYLDSFSKTPSKTKILYYQCCFSGDNSMGVLSKDTEKEVREWLSQLGEEFTTNLADIQRKYQRQSGEFLQADTLLLLRHRRKLRILVVDLSVFSVRQAEDLLNLKDKTLDTHRRLLRREISYLKSKSVFTKLRLDTGSEGELDFEFSEKLKRYFTAFKRQDKESVKLIQAGSYAYSFYNFLQNYPTVEGKKLAGEDIQINVVGYSDRNLSIMSLHSQYPQHQNLLRTCHEIYSQEHKNTDINLARQDVLKVIRRNVAKSFHNGKTLIKNLENLQPNKINIIPPHQETLENFQSTAALRQPHAEAVKTALNSDKTFLFLTGNPGIGKTTAIVEFLKSHLEEGCLFFYVSPRKQVNLDIIEKFKNSQTGELVDDRLFCMTTNATILDEYKPQQVVKYSSGHHKTPFSSHGTQFIPLNDPPPPRTPSQSSIKRINDRQMRNKKNHKNGVLSTLCKGIYNVINDPISNTVVATACIQSLRITKSGQNTLDNFKEIFKGFYNTRLKTVNFHKMRELSSRVKHLFIMIDEITGDQSGVEFLKEIKRTIQDYKLNHPESGFNLKVIVADASIVDGKVIKQHLEDTSPEPDKIFVRQVKKPGDNLDLGVFSQEFPFGLYKNDHCNGIAINANSYPANRLHLTYKPFIESIQFDRDKLDQQKDNLPKAVFNHILDDLNQLRHRPDTGQILVYIQNKQRLQELIGKIQETESFIKQEDYLEVHADLSDEERQNIRQHQDHVKVVFMTSSASRGLSFPKSQHILVEIPQFQVENNLMEIIQVIYRCRGQFWEGEELKTLDNAEKYLTFYLCDRAIYYPEPNSLQLSLQESLLSLLNLFVILKTAIMTRIQGYGQIGRYNFMMIPIGGKSVFASGQSFTGQLATLIRDLEKESWRNPQNTTVKELAASLQNLLSRGKFLLMNDPSPQNQETSYLKLQQDFNHHFANYCKTLDGLLNLNPVELGHICGSVLLVPLRGKTLAETYEMRLADIYHYATETLLKRMLAIRESGDYSPNLKSLINRGIDLINELQKPHNYTQQLQQKNNWSDQYYAIPLFTFLVGDMMRDYFQEGNEPDDKKDRFRHLLHQYLRQLYPTDQVLPIGENYQAFPFLIFRSYSLDQMRSKLFTDRYLLSSQEFNLLNLILGIE
ncbi:helicase-related protein [Spirulina sp. CS-785/01]|uniref:helicase-related protein n=1 Tax=Spirulina sp. CS-785/01 TaxID=3021716 RepID=UPI002330730D|nr:helicase-related protein [Spirulina sp. CS-785/01]MDB9311969.1 helicase-related protein [Spirulina sp. CS-785/01]